MALNWCDECTYTVLSFFNVFSSFSQWQSQETNYLHYRKCENRLENDLHVKKNKTNDFFVRNMIRRKMWTHFRMWKRFTYTFNCRPEETSVNLIWWNSELKLFYPQMWLRNNHMRVINQLTTARSTSASFFYPIQKMRRKSFWQKSGCGSRSNLHVDTKPFGRRCQHFVAKAWSIWRISPLLSAQSNRSALCGRLWQGNETHFSKRETKASGSTRQFSILLQWIEEEDEHRSSRTAGLVLWIE